MKAFYPLLLSSVQGTWNVWVEKKFCGFSLVQLGEKDDSQMTLEDCAAFCQKMDRQYGGDFPQDTTFCCDYEEWSYDGTKLCKLWQSDNQRN